MKKTEFDEKYKYSERPDLCCQTCQQVLITQDTIGRNVQLFCRKKLIMVNSTQLSDSSVNQNGHCTLFEKYEVKDSQ